MEVENQEQNPRLAALTRRLEQVFEEAVARLAAAGAGPASGSGQRRGGIAAAVAGD